jgi:1-phosphofructokinase
VSVRGALRVCTKIVDEGRKHTIEINEQGVPVTREDGELLLQKIKEVAKRCAFLTLSGSLPKGLDADFYATCAAAVRKSAPACRVVLDAEGEQLLAAMREGAYLIKPNIHEFSATFGWEPKDAPALDEAVQDVLSRYPVEIVCVSLGADGAYIGTRQEAYFCPALSVEPRSLQGAGDAMVAGLCVALEQGLSLPDVLCHGVCLASAAIMTEGTRPGSRADFERLLQGIPVPQRLR